MHKTEQAQVRQSSSTGRGGRHTVPPLLAFDGKERGIAHVQMKGYIPKSIIWTQWVFKNEVKLDG